MHIRPDVFHRLAAEVLDILVYNGSVKKVTVNDAVDQIMSDEVAPLNLKVFYRRDWDSDEDGTSAMESRSKARYELVKWLRFNKELDNETMERLVAIGVVGKLVWWGNLMAEVLDRIPTVNRLGSGASGTVYGFNGKNYVMKTIIGSDHDAWHTFAQKVIDSNDNPFLPRIHQIWFWEGVMVAKMELLEQDGLYKEDAGTMFRHLLYHNVKPEDIVADHYVGSIGSDPKAIDWLKEVAIIVGEVAQETGGGWDCHNGNVLFRDGIPVLIDPIAGGECQYAVGMSDHHQKLKEALYAPQ